MQIKFGTKAETLVELKGIIKKASIAELMIINFKEWRSQKEAVIKSIKSCFGSNELIIRSSSFDEDTDSGSNAGAFKTILNVTASGIAEAVDNVYGSYKKANVKSQVLIQPMLKNVVRSGVAFSHDASSGAAYISINWSDSDDTEAVTAGKKGLKYCQISSSGKNVPAEHNQVFELITEISNITERSPIDIEFAITDCDGEKKIWLLQARALILKAEPEAADKHTARLKMLEAHLTKAFSRHPFLVGDKTFFGVMPDWNPAEIIGLRPRPLALSLYRELVTDSIWAYQRNNYGYRNLRGFPLLRNFHGLPYVDVRVSLNSFIPADLSEIMAERLANFYLTKLAKNPELHDKIEFDVVCSCYTFDIEKRFVDFRRHGFDEESLEIFSNSLRKLTNNVLHPEKGLWKKDEQKIKILTIRREELSNSSLSLEEKLFWLIEDTRRYGTLPFAGLARAGFIAVQMLQSLVNVGVFSDHDYDRFMSSVSTVASSMALDRHSDSREVFLNKYGHLRPGTYDIMSPRYDTEPNDYFDWSKSPSEPNAKKEFTLSVSQLSAIKKLLHQHKIESDPVQLIEFIQSAISLREYAKFEFTKNLSDFLELYTLLGQEHGYTREELSYSNIQIIRDIYVESNSPKELFEKSINKGKSDYKLAQLTSLPPLISSPSDAWSIIWPEAQANYITMHQITAGVANLEESDDLEGKIVCIRGADPGYDWIFERKIVGLITCWGGANSHMAIRSGELGLPAVIGAGELDYNRWCVAKKLSLDCSNKVVLVID